MPVDWPDPDELSALYQQMRDGDPLALEDFCAAALPPLVEFLRRRRRHSDDHLHQVAATEALLSLLDHPTRFDPSKGNLISYLCLSADRDFLNALSKEARHRRNREPQDCVELPADDGNTSDEECLPSFDGPELAPVIAKFSVAERQVLDLMRRGEHDTDAFAPVIGVEHLSVAERKRAVKQVKDRIMARLKRAGGGHE